MVAEVRGDISYSQSYRRYLLSIHVRVGRLMQCRYLNKYNPCYSKSLLHNVLVNSELVLEGRSNTISFSGS